MIGYISNLKSKVSGAESINNALSGEVKKYRDKTGAEITEKNLILSSYKSLKAVHAADSSEIGRLQKLINKNTLGATIFGTSTKGKSTGTTTIVIVTNGNNKDSLTKITLSPCDTIYPEYHYVDSTKWVNVKVKATKDSTHVDYKFYNEYEITQEFKKTGTWPFRKKEPIVKIRNLNPNTETTKISSFAVQSPKEGGKKATIAGVGAVIGFLAAVFLLK